MGWEGGGGAVLTRRSERPDLVEDVAWPGKGRGLV